MSVVMPDADQAVLARRAQIVAALQAIVPGEGVISAERAMRPYESDGLTAYKQLPMVVVLPETTDQVAAVLRYCHDNGIKVVPRGAGTSLSGGRCRWSTACCSAWASSTASARSTSPTASRWSSPASPISPSARRSQAEGFYYAPDPSSQIACTIGGNVAENSGGVHCLKYGMTTNNILGLEMVLMTGEVLRLGGKHLDAGGYDLIGIITGSEGLLGVVTEVTVRILKKPETARAVLVGFPSAEDAGECVSRIIGAGIIPGGMEMMDKPAIHATEEFVHAGYPLDVEALLIVELDGPAAEVDHLIERVDAIAKACRSIDAAGYRTPKTSGCCSGPAARRRSRRSAASRRITTAWTAPSRAPSCRWCSSASANCPSTTGCASPTCSMPATATCIRSFSTTPTSRANWRRPRSSAPKS